VKVKYAEPTGGWKTLKNMHAQFLQDARSRPEGTPWGGLKIVPFKLRILKYKPITFRPGEEYLITPNDEAAWEPSPEEYKSATEAMIKTATLGNWYAIGRRPGKRKVEKLIPPGQWKSLRLDIEKGTAGSGGLRYENLRCAFSLFASKKMQKQIQESLRTNGQPGRPTKMKLIRKELERRIGSGQTLPTCAAEARHLVAWFKKEHPDEERPVWRTVNNAIRDAYKAGQTLAANKRTNLRAASR
jgi:hypothetical protein